MGLLLDMKRLEPKVARASKIGKETRMEESTRNTNRAQDRYGRAWSGPKGIAPTHICASPPRFGKELRRQMQPRWYRGHSSPATSTGRASGRSAGAPRAGGLPSRNLQAAEAEQQLGNLALWSGSPCRNGNHQSIRKAIRKWSLPKGPPPPPRRRRRRWG